MGCRENPRQRIAWCQLSTKSVPPVLLSNSLTNVWHLQCLSYGKRSTHNWAEDGICTCWQWDLLPPPLGSHQVTAACGTWSQIILTFFFYLFFLAKDDVQGFIVACSLTDYTEDIWAGLENMKQEMFSQSTSLFLIISGKHSGLGPYNLVTIGMISFSQFLRKKKKWKEKDWCLFWTQFSSYWSY